MMGKKYVRGKEEQDHEYIVGGAHAQRAPDLFCVAPSSFFICGSLMAREALKPRFPRISFGFLCLGSLWISLAYLMDCPLT